MSDQVRSAHDELDWKNEVHVFYLNLSANPMPKFNFSGTLSYTVARGYMDSPYMPSLTITNSGESFIAGYNPALMNNADNYSKLDYKALEFELRANYQLLKNVSLTLNYWYSHFLDDKRYVYGDLDGSAYVLTGFVTFSF